MPANMAVAVNPDLEYAVVQHEKTGKLLVAMDRYWDIDYRAMIERMLPSLTQSAPGLLNEPNFPSLRTVVFWRDAIIPGTRSLTELVASTVNQSALVAAEAKLDWDDPILLP